MTARPFLNSVSLENEYDFTLSKRDVSHGWEPVVLLTLLLSADVASFGAESRVERSAVVGEEDAIVFDPTHMKCNI